MMIEKHSVCPDPTQATFVKCLQMNLLLSNENTAGIKYLHIKEKGHEAVDLVVDIWVTKWEVTWLGWNADTQVSLKIMRPANWQRREEIEQVFKKNPSNTYRDQHVT